MKNKTKTIENLKEIASFLNNCFNTLEARLYWLLHYDNLCNSERGFILKYISLK